MYNNLELATKIGAVLISLLVFIKGIHEYTKAQRWKKGEFVAKEIKEFQNDFDIKRAMILLDWNCKELDLRPNEIEGKTKFIFTDDLLKSALQTHRNITTFSLEEVVIKGILDSFFDRLTLFNNYIETELISVNDIKPYLIYWIKILADPENGRKPKEIRILIWKYLKEYEYNGVIEFYHKLGFEDRS